MGKDFFIFVILSFRSLQSELAHANECNHVILRADTLLCRLRSVAVHIDHFVRRLTLSVRLSVCLSICLSGSHSFLVVTHRMGRFLGITV